MSNKALPPDPESMNDTRSEWAKVAIDTFEAEQGSDDIADLLCDLAHYCDRNNLNFKNLLNRAAGHYIEETSEQGTQFGRAADWDELFDLLSQDIYTDAPEYRDRVERVEELAGQLRGEHA